MVERYIEKKNTFKGTEDESVPTIFFTHLRFDLMPKHILEKVLFVSSMYSHYRHYNILLIYIFLLFYYVFNNQGHIVTRSLWVEGPVHTSLSISAL